MAETSDDTVGEADDASGGAETSDRTVTGWALARRLHPLGWVAVGFAVVALIATAAGWDLLIARMPWWLWLVTVATIVVSAFPLALHGIRLAIEVVSGWGGRIALFLAWFIFVIQLFNVITRYTNNWFDQDILFAETTSLAWMSFGALFLVGVAYGVRNGVNPRIDFWWAEFSPQRKAWIDFVLHTFLFLPFLIVGLRVLAPFAARSLGYNRFANGGAGEWPEGWAVWRSWETSSNAGELPLGPIQAFILVGFAMWTAQVVAEIIKTGFVIAGREDLGAITDADEAPPRIE